MSINSRAWSNAKRAVCSRLHSHPSRLEARVCEEVHLEARSEGWTVYRQVRLPLWSLAPEGDGKAMYFTVDFALVGGGQLRRLIDAKGRESRDWRRGAKACEASYGIRVEERRG